MKPTEHPLQKALEARVRLLETTLQPSTVKQYRRTVRLFLGYLSQNFPEVHRPRSEEHTSELQSLRHLVCRLLLEKNAIGPDRPRRRRCPTPPAVGCPAPRAARSR